MKNCEINNTRLFDLQTDYFDQQSYTNSKYF